MRDPYTNAADYKPLKIKFKRHFKEFFDFTRFVLFAKKNLHKLSNWVLFLDDCDREAVSSEFICKICKVWAHHVRVSLILTSQTVFAKGKHFIEVTHNCTFIVLFFSPKSAAQYCCFSYQLNPHNTHLISDIFRTLKKNFPKRRVYIFCDFRPYTGNEHRLFFGLPGELPNNTRVYYPIE